jgi:23S rRNA (adenine2030-N6)-methyltransferase
MILPALKEILAQDRFPSHLAFWLRAENKTAVDAEDD